MAQQQIQKKRALASGRIVGGEVVSGELMLPGEPIPAAKRQRPVKKSVVDILAWDPSIIEFSFGARDGKPWTDVQAIFNNDVSSILSKIDMELERLGVLRQREIDQWHGRAIHLSIPTGAYLQIEAAS